MRPPTHCRPPLGLLQPAPGTWLLLYSISWVLGSFRLFDSPVSPLPLRFYWGRCVPLLIILCLCCPGKGERSICLLFGCVESFQRLTIGSLGYNLRQCGHYFPERF